MDERSETAFPRVDRFENRGEMGRGASGVVFRAYDKELKQEVALKTLPRPKSDDAVRLKSEFRLLARVTHPNLVELHELFVVDGACFFTMELVDGEHYLDYAMNGDRLVRVQQTIPQLVSAIETLHANQLRHADIKPSNVMVTRDGRVKVLDFGLADAMSQRPKGDVRISGTLIYTAPEAMERKAQADSDWFSLGVVLYEALAGSRPFEGTGIELLVKKKRNIVVSLAERASFAPDWLSSAVMNLISPKIDERKAALQILRGSAPPPVVTSNLFVARQKELSSLSALYSELRDERRSSIVWVRGASGLGKSALLSKFAVGLERQALVLSGRCHPCETVPYNVLDGAIDDLVQTSSAPLTADPALLRMFPALGSTTEALPQNVDSQQELRQRGADALAELLAAQAKQRPLVLILEDVHWGDLDSAWLLRHLLHRPNPPPVMLLLSHRPDEQSRFLRDLAAAPIAMSPTKVLEIDLQPLDADASLSLALAMSAGDRAKAQEIASAASGSPYLIGEMARFHRESAGAIGASLGELVQHRLELLDETSRRCVELASLASRPLSRELLLRSAPESNRRVWSRLENSCLLRSIDDGDELTVYHDRIRQGVWSVLSPELRRERHRTLASAFEAELPGDHESLAFHFSEAGERLRAADHAEKAAERAQSALAFDRAAELYGQALEWGPADSMRSARLRTARARALFNAGRSAAAAPEFMAAASAASDRERWALQTSAIESYLLAGRIEEGLNIAKPMLVELGGKYPRSESTAMFGLAAEMVRLLIGGSKMPSRPAAVDPRVVARVDLQWALAKGLIYVLSMKGTWFLLLSLRGALALGDPHRSGRALALAGTGLFQLPGLRVRGEAMIRAAQSLAETHDDDSLRGASLAWEAMRTALIPDWPRVKELAERSLAILEKQVGTHWEQVVAAGMWMWAVQYMGGFKAADGFRARWQQICADRGDLYGQVLFMQNRLYYLVKSGNIAAARADIRWYRENWIQDRYTPPRFYVMSLEATALLYEGDHAAALKVVLDDQPDFKKAGGYRSAITRTEMQLLEARARLNNRSFGPVPALITALAKNSRPDARTHAHAMRACLATWRGGDLLSELDLALDGYSKGRLGLHHAVTLRAKGELTGDQAMIARADGWMLEHGITDPVRMTKIWMPTRQNST